jgi:hypothetical protein
VERDLTGYDTRKSKQGCEVEHIRADRYPGTHAVVMPTERRHCGRDLGRVGCQRGEHSQERLGETKSCANPAEPRHEEPARRKACRRSDHKQTRR